MDTALLSTALLPPAEDPKPKKPAEIDNNTRREWNNYVEYLSKKGMKGDPSLDKGENSFAMLEQYRKENPNTTLTREMITPIQASLSEYRQYMLNKIKTNPKGAAFAPGTTEENFMSGLSKIDGIPGSKTTSYSFPSMYLNDLDKKQTVNKGFSTTSSNVYVKN